MPKFSPTMPKLELERGARASSALLERFAEHTDLDLPKYAQLKQMILAAIESGYWPSGAQIPSEGELADVTPFSLGTVQRALRALVEEGVIVRRQGHGSFIAEPLKQMEHPWHCRFVADDGASFLPIYPKVLHRERMTDKGPWTRHLGEPAKGLLRIDRKLSINLEFVVYSKFVMKYQKGTLLASLPVAELDGANFKLILKRDLKLPITSIQQTMRARLLPDDVCEAIDQPSGTAGMMVKAIASAGREAIYYQELYIPPTERELYVGDFRPRAPI